VPEESGVARGLEALNAVLDGARERLRVRRVGPGFARDSEPAPENSPDPALRVARRAADLLGRLEPRRLKQCANPGCDLLFYDETRNASRRWCSVSLCGNRLKQARFRLARPVVR